MGWLSKKCPFCAETIKAEAKVCKHCGRDLVAANTLSQVPLEVEKLKKKKSFFHGCGTLSIIGILLMIATYIGGGLPKTPEQTPAQRQQEAERREAQDAIDAKNKQERSKADAERQAQRAKEEAAKQAERAAQQAKEREAELKAKEEKEKITGKIRFKLIPSVTVDDVFKYGLEGNALESGDAVMLEGILASRPDIETNSEGDDVRNYSFHICGTHSQNTIQVKCERIHKSLFAPILARYEEILNTEHWIWVVVPCVVRKSESGDIIFTPTSFPTWRMDGSTIPPFLPDDERAEALNEARRKFEQTH